MPAKAYSSYRDSGVEWIGQIPEHWKIRSIKDVLDSTYSGGTPDSKEPSFYHDSGVYWVNIADITREGTILSTNKRLTEAGIANKKLRVLRENTLLVSMYATLGKTAVLGVPATISQAILALFPNSLMTRDYLRILIEAMRPYLSYYATASTQENLSAQRISSLPAVVPPVEEQQAIAAFLDRETTKIDTLVAKQEQLINFLKEKRSGLISHAVTKGLNSAATMKPSGVEWIGEVPKHWSAKPLWSVARCNATALSETTDPLEQIDYIEISDVNSEEGIISSTSYKFADAPSRARRVVRQGDVLISTVRTYLRAIASAQDVHDGMIASTGFAVLTPLGVFPAFLRYAVLGEQFISGVIANSVGVSYPAIRSSDVMNLRVVFPPFEEQKTIAAYLDRETAKIDKLVDRATATIAFLKERRASLITAAVTGQIDVRGIQDCLGIEHD